MCLWEECRVWTISDLIGQLLVAVGGQTVHHDDILVRFSDEPSGKKWPPIQASAHYHLVFDEGGDLKIKRINYWTQSSKEDLQDLFDLWLGCKEKALEGLAKDYFAIPR